MKYNININQLALAESNLDLLDAAILDYLVLYCNSKSPMIEKERLHQEDGIWTWINYQSVIDQNPLLRVTAISSVARRIDKIEKDGFVKLHHINGGKVYISLTDKVDDLYFVPLRYRKATVAPTQRYRSDSATYNSNKDNKNELVSTTSSEVVKKPPISDFEEEAQDISVEPDEDYVPTGSLARKNAISAGYQGHLVKPIMSWAESIVGQKYVNTVKQQKAISEMLKKGYSEQKIKACFESLGVDPYWQQKGYDFMTVANEISKKKGKSGMKVIGKKHE